MKSNEEKNKGRNEVDLVKGDSGTSAALLHQIIAYLISGKHSTVNRGRK